MIRHATLLVVSLVTMLSCNGKPNTTETTSGAKPAISAGADTAIFASGCFWCTEAVFERVKGVEDVVSGYSGGPEKNPTYSEVSAGRTEHAEAVRVIYDPEVVSYHELVEMFFASHDPTQLNRQGPDVGKQYRSAIFYRNNEEKQTAEEVMKELDASGKYKRPIVTEITPFTAFYEAEDYHQNYYELHPDQPYVSSVSRPKVEKFMKEYKHKLKEKYKE